MRAVVVGAGVIGASIALELARSGVYVTVVDKAGAAGHGSTSASSAVVRFNFSTKDSVALSWESKHCWERWHEHLGSPADGPNAHFHRAGLVMLDVDAASAAGGRAVLGGRIRHARCGVYAGRRPRGRPGSRRRPISSRRQCGMGRGFCTTGESWVCFVSRVAFPG